SFASFTLSDLKEIVACVEDVPAVQASISKRLEEVAGVSLNLERCEALSNRRADVDEMITLLADEVSFRFFKTMINETDDETSLLWLQNMERLVMNCFTSEGVEVSLRSDQIGICQSALQQ